MNETKQIWHSLAEVPDFSRSKDGILRIMLTDGKEMQPMDNCTEDNFKYMHLYYYGAKAWAYYGDLLPDKVTEEPERISAYEFVGDSEKIYKWLFSDNLKLIGIANFKYGDEITEQDNFIITIERSTNRCGEECISMGHPRYNDGNYGVDITVEGEPQEFMSRLVEERHIRVIPPTYIK
jgi:hypothetical protein